MAGSVTAASLPEQPPGPGRRRASARSACR
jgi:hypothetical protein